MTDGTDPQWDGPSGPEAILPLLPFSFPSSFPKRCPMRSVAPDIQGSRVVRQGRIKVPPFALEIIPNYSCHFYLLCPSGRYFLKATTNYITLLLPLSTAQTFPNRLFPKTNILSPHGVFHSFRFSFFQQATANVFLALSSPPVPPVTAFDHPVVAAHPFHRFQQPQQ